MAQCLIAYDALPQYLSSVPNTYARQGYINPSPGDFTQSLVMY